MQVRATSMGFFGGSRRRVGEVFDVPEGTRASWFVPVGVASAAPTDPAKTARRPRPVALSQVAREQTTGPLDSLV
jgi:hypothetical protein